jgi:hypothetical protein
MVTEFPVFSKLTLEDKSSLDDFNAKLPPYADWAYGTLMTWWDAFGDLEVARIGNNLVIKSSYLSMGKVVQFVLLGNSEVDASIEILFAHQKNADLEPALYSLPQYTIDAIQHPERYLIVDDPNAAEYILSAEMHATLEGSEMRRIRQKVMKFRHTTEDHEVETTRMTLDNIHAKMRLINSLHTWSDGIYKNDNERLEGIIIDRALLMAENIGMECFALFIDKALHGFVLYKYLPDHTININHIKVSYAYPSIFSYISEALAKHVYDEGIIRINLEQDLGIEGLRIHKTQLRPVEMFHKYNVYPR